MSPASQIYAKITGPIVMVGFGSIGKGTLPLIERHLDYDKSRITVIDPKDEGRKAHCAKHNVRFIQKGVTKDNYRELLTPLLTEGGGQGFCVNLSVDTGSTDIMELCNELCAHLYRHCHRALSRLLFRFSKGLRKRAPLRLREVTRPQECTAAARPPSRAAAPIPAWFVVRQAGPAHLAAMEINQRTDDAQEWAAMSASASCSTSPNATPSAPNRRKSRTCSSTPGRWKASCRRACSRPNSVGAPMKNGCPKMRVPTKPAAAPPSI